MRAGRGEQRCEGRCEGRAGRGEGRCEGRAGKGEGRCEGRAGPGEPGGARGGVRAGAGGEGCAQLVGALRGVPTAERVEPGRVQPAGAAGGRACEQTHIHTR